MPCLYCKAPHVSEQCPVLAKSRSLLHVKQTLSSPTFSGAAPAPFIGQYGYPHVNVGILTPPYIREQAWEYDAPQHWVSEQYAIPRIVDLRSSLVQSRTTAHIKQPTPVVELAQLIGMADKPVDIEVTLKKIPNFSFTVDAHHAPMGPHAPLQKAELTSNPSIPTKVDKIVNDDLLAQEAILSLYEKGTNEHALSKLLSVGVLGKQRKLVPTKWSITATDDMLGKHLYQEIIQHPTTDDNAFFGSYLGNYYLILFLQGSWSYELFEIALPGVYDAMGGVSTDHEDIFGRKDYAHNCAGGYYTVRLAILEKLAALKRQARVLVFRFITSEYTIPLGVWVTREAARNSLAQKPITFATQELLLTYAKHLAQRKFGYDIKHLLILSKVLKEKQQSFLEFVA